MAWCAAARRVGVLLGVGDSSVVANGGRRSFHGTREGCYKWLKEYKSQLLATGAVLAAYAGAFYVPLPLMGSRKDDEDVALLAAEEVAKFVSVENQILSELQANDNILSKLQIEISDVRTNSEEEINKVKKEMEMLQMSYSKMAKEQSMIIALLKEWQFGKLPEACSGSEQDDKKKPWMNNSFGLASGEGFMHGHQFSA